MNNVRSKQQSVKNKRNQDIHSFKSCKLYCSCSANSKFKRNQSDNRFNVKSDPWIQANRDSDKFLRDEFKRYGLDPRKLTENTFKYHTPGYEEKCCMKNLTPNGIELLDRPNLKSKTDSNLAYEKYVEDLKKEIRAQREDIPLLPKKYKQKYLNSIKEELLLNKVTSEHENNKKVKELIKEIQVYRATNKLTPYLDSIKSNKIKPNDDVPLNESKVSERSRKNNLKTSSENGSPKDGKRRKMKKRSPSRYKSQGGAGQ